jgi:hypothetical protein
MEKPGSLMSVRLVQVEKQEGKMSTKNVKAEFESVGYVYI